MKHIFFYDNELLWRLVRRSIISYYELLSIALAIFGGFLFCTTIIELEYKISLSISVFIGIFELIRKFLLNWIYCKVRMSKAYFKCEHIVELNDKSIISSSYLGRGELYWKSIEKIYKKYNNINFVYCDNDYLSIPYSSFLNEESREEFYNQAIELWNNKK